MTEASIHVPPPHDREIRGVRIWDEFLDVPTQQAILADVDAIASAASFVRPTTPWGKPMSVEMTSAGRYGWITDRRGYRYETRRANGAPWPPIPGRILEVWRALSGTDRQPDCCLVNRYGPKSRMGLHQDRDEGDFSFPVLSISLGDDALFRVGGTERRGSTESAWLRSGDVVLLAGEARLAYHGVDRIREGASSTAALAGPHQPYTPRGRVRMTGRKASGAK